ncbi:MAG: cytochrome-c peroxidase [Gammaproteobacteria bacterium]|nr:cytochrome-c peroxidase [Gammaproteobacteria bacterium]
MKYLLLLAALLTGSGVIAWHTLSLPLPENWSERDRILIRSMALSQLPTLPADPGNAVADLEAAATLGHRLYFDQRLSGNNNVACASCHRPELTFTDGLALAVGTATGQRHTPGLAGVSHSPWFYWDGRKDSQWAQALAPLENPHEHNSDRTRISRLVTSDPQYRKLYESVFGFVPTIPDQPMTASPLTSDKALANWQTLPASQQKTINQVFSNVGKALAAYQRKLMPGAGRFDDYADSLQHSAKIDANTSLDATELAGLALFIGKAQCVSCHNGPQFTNHDFHNTGVQSLTGELPPMGRFDGIRLAREDEFNCLGEYSDADSAECSELRFAGDSNELVGAHKTPSLRNVATTAPYMHNGQMRTLTEVLRHYNEAPISMLSHNEAKPLGLRPVELRQLEAFLHTLTAPLATDDKWLSAPQP